MKTRINNALSRILQRYDFWRNPLAGSKTINIQLNENDDSIGGWRVFSEGRELLRYVKYYIT